MFWSVFDMCTEGRSAAPDHLDLASDLEFPAQAGQLAFSPPSNSSPSPFMQFAASMASQGNISNQYRTKKYC